MRPSPAATALLPTTSAHLPGAQSAQASGTAPLGAAPYLPAAHATQSVAAPTPAAALCAPAARC
jgi:hypothetical protein